MPHNCLGDYVNPLCITKRWGRFANSNNIPYTTFGNLRSVYATLCAEAGCIDSIVSRSMGHAGTSVKDRNYLSTSLSSLKINATMLASYIKPEAFENGDNSLSQAEMQNLQLLLQYRRFNL